MQVLIAPDSFKNSLNSFEICDSIEEGINNYNPNIICEKCPMADGGEGTLKVIVESTGGNYLKTNVFDPIGREITSYFAISGDGKTAIIEMARASGIELLSYNERNPLKTSTYGTGQLILNALNYDVEKIILFIGGSATNDCGGGMAEAIGYKFFDSKGNLISISGETLALVNSIKINDKDLNKLRNVIFEIACDVNNVLCGETGASLVFSRQKGADEKMAKLLDRNLFSFSKVILKDLGMDIRNIKGSGAAGGLGGGGIAFLDAKLKSGFEVVSEMVDLEKKIINSDLVITGEGCIDFQTSMGKTPFGVAQIAKKFNKPVIGICGTLGNGYRELYKFGFDSLFSIINKPISIEESIKESYDLIRDTSERIIRAINLLI